MHKVPDHLAIEAAPTGITNCLASGDSINYIYYRLDLQSVEKYDLTQQGLLSGSV